MSKRPSGSLDSLDNRSSLLVAEQSGLMVMLSGLAIAFLLGFLVRGLTNEEMIKSKVITLLKNHGPEEQVQLERAWVRLSRGAWPDFSLVLSQVHVESSNPCALSPAAEINEIRFPLSLWGLIKGGIVFDTAEIDQAVLLLRTDPKECHSYREPSSVNLKEVTEPETTSTPPANVHSTEPPSVSSQIPLRKIEVQKLRVNYLPIPFSTFEFQDLEAEVESLTPLNFDIQSHLDLNGETLSGDYSSHAFWKFQYDESQKIRGRLELSGTWREGRYDLNADFEGPSKKYDLSMQLQHIPLSQIFPVLKKYKIMVSDFNGKQSWISAKAQSTGQWDHMAKAPWIVSQFSLEGDLGEVHSESIHFSQLEPIAFEPVQFDLKNVDFDKLLEFLGKSHPSPALGHLGVFGGQVVFRSPAEATLEGEHRGLEFIFSNKGSRQIQAIESFKTKLEFKDNSWIGRFSNFELPQGQLDGEVLLKADKDWKDLDLKAEFQELRLSPSIENLITQGGTLKDFSGKVRARLAAGSLKTLEGNLKGGDWQIEGLKIMSPQFRLGQNKDLFTLQVQLAELVIPAKSAGTEMLKTLQKENPELWSEPLDFKNVSAQIETEALKNFRWTEFKAQSEKLKIQSRGGWDYENQLSGEIKVIDKRKTYKWKLQGSRDIPQFLKN